MNGGPGRRTPVSVAFQRLRQAPDDVERWRGLWDQAGRQASAELVEAVVRDLPDEGVAGWLRATWLLLVTQQSGWLRRMGELTQPGMALFPQRLESWLLLLQSVMSSSAEGHLRARELIDGMGTHRLLALEAGRLMAGRVPEAAEVASVRRVALVAPLLGNLPHPPTQLAFEHVKVLRRLGLAVGVFSPEETRSAGSAEVSPLPLNFPHAPFDRSAWQDAFGDEVTVHAADPSRPVEERWSQVLGEVDGFSPDVVLFVGLLSPVVEPLWRKYPVVALPTSGVAPPVPADVWLASDPPASMLSPPADFTMPQAVPYAFRASVQSPASADRTGVGRDDFHIPGRAVVLATAGVRLHQEIRGAWAAAMARLLARRPDLVWMLIGDVRTPAELAPLARQLRAMPFQPALAEVLGLADIFVNPPRTGGGISVAIAMAQGMPVVAYRGTDGGDKLGGQASADDASYFRKLEKLIDSRSERKALGAQLKKRYELAVDLRKADEPLGRALEIARRRFNLRRSGPAVS